MSLKVLFVLIAALLAIQFAIGAPASDDTNNLDELPEKFMEFLREDREFHGLLEHPRLMVNNLYRDKRQAVEGVDIDGMDGMDGDKPKEPGFFDRAAKFVMEVLQRFLKWINSSEN